MRYIVKVLFSKSIQSLVNANSRSSSRNINKVEDIFKALDILIEYGYITELEEEERKGSGRKRDIFFELNPLYFKK